MLFREGRLFMKQNSKKGIIMRCEYCGYEGNDFEEDFCHQKGAWCPACEGFQYHLGKENHAAFHVLLERKNSGVEGVHKKTSLKKRISPLRYPGGKSKAIDMIYPFLSERKVFVEPFCGGASVGLSMLDAGRINKLVLNDMDQDLYTFWKVVCGGQCHELIERIRNYQPTREDYFKYREELKNPYLQDVLRAFYFFVINRCSFSGIKMSNPKADVMDRWNAEALTKRICHIHEMADAIRVFHQDALTIIEEYYWGSDVCLFIDPPYVKKGDMLYPEKFARHKELSWLLTDLIKEVPGCASIVLTYDDEEMIRDLYDFPNTEIHFVNRRYSCA